MWKHLFHLVQTKTYFLFIQHDLIVPFKPIIIKLGITLFFREFFSRCLMVVKRFTCLSCLVNCMDSFSFPFSLYAVNVFEISVENISELYSHFYFVFFLLFFIYQYN